MNRKMREGVREFEKMASGIRRISLAGVAVFFFFMLFLVQGIHAAEISSPPEDLLLRAREAYNARRFHEAASLYRDYLSLVPEGGARDEAGFFRAQSLFLVGDLEAARKAFLEEEGRNKAYADQVLYYLGEISWLIRDGDQALVYFDRLLQEFPDSPLANKAAERSGLVHLYLGDHYASRGAWSLALQHYLLAQSAPSSLAGRVFYKQGMAYYKAGNLDKAEQVWGDLAASKQEESEQAPVLARYRLARLLEELGRYDEAALNYEQLLKENPGHYLTPLARQGLVRVYASSGNFEKAQQAWTQSEEGEKLEKNGKAFALGIDHFLHEEFVDAEQVFKELAREAEDPELAWSAALWLARSYAAQGKVKETRESWEQVLADESRTSPEVRLEAAEDLYESAPELAAAALKELVDSGSGKPRNEEALGLSAVLELEARSPQGFKLAEKYLQFFPSGSHAGEVYLLLGLREFEKGRLDRAEEHLGQAAEIHPSAQARVRALRALSLLLRSQGRFSSAREALEKAKALAETIPPLSRGLDKELAETAYAQGDYSTGIAIYEALCGDSVSEKSCSPSERFRLFFGYYRAGNTESALSALEHVSEAGEEWKARAGFWEGLIHYEAGDFEDALSGWEGLEFADPVEAGLLKWMRAAAWEKQEDFENAWTELRELKENYPAAGFYCRPRLMQDALASEKPGLLLKTLPPGDELDRDFLGEKAILAAMKKEALINPEPEELNRLAELLGLEAFNETAVEEGVMLSARAALGGEGRREALARMGSLLLSHPGTPFGSEIRFYQAQDAFLKKDYYTAAALMERVNLEELPEDIRFHALYIKGQANKKLREFEKMRPAFLRMVQEYGDKIEDPDKWLEAGVGLALAREFTSALQALELALSQGKDEKLLAEAMYWKGMVLAGSGKQEEALKLFLEIPSRFPSQLMWAATALNEAAEIYVAEKRYDEALALYRRILEMSKGDQKTTRAVKAKIAEVKKLKRLENPILSRP